jgi:hypothetical protein
MITGNERDYATLLMQNPQTLHWHLLARGYPTSPDPEINKRTAHALFRLTDPSRRKLVETAIAPYGFSSPRRRAPRRARCR